MNNKAVIYAKGFTNEEAESHLEPIKEYCNNNGLEIVKVLLDETTYKERDFDCLKNLYEYMSTKKVRTIIFASFYPYLSMRKYIMKFGIFSEFDTLNFDYDHLGLKLASFDNDEEMTFNQANFDTNLSVDFGNLVEQLSKNREDFLFISREENARLIEDSKWAKQKDFREFIKDKGILGIVFNEGNKSTMISYLAHESDMDQTGDTSLVVYSNYNNLENFLSSTSNQFYKIIFDGAGSGYLDDFRDLVLLCEEYVEEVQFCFGHLSSKSKYKLIEILDELTGNA